MPIQLVDDAETLLRVYILIFPASRIKSTLTYLLVFAILRGENVPILCGV